MNNSNKADEFERNWYGENYNAKHHQNDEADKISKPKETQIRSEEHSFEEDFSCDFKIVDNEIRYIFPSEIDSGFDAAIGEQEKNEQERLGKIKSEGWVTVGKYQGHIVAGDIIKFEEAVWGKDFHEKKYMGQRCNVVRITHESVSKNMQHRLYFEVMDSSGTEPLATGTKKWRLNINITKRECYRQLWKDEAARKKAVTKSKKYYRIKSDERSKLQYDLTPDGYIIESTSSKNQCKKEYPYVEVLSEEEQHWVDSWYQDIVIDESSANGFGEWDPEAGWWPLYENEDMPMVGDVIRFIYPIFTARYPKGKYCGRYVMIAKITKIGRKYYDLKYIASSGTISSWASGDEIKQTINSVHFKAVYRLPWINELPRMKKFSKMIGEEFGSFEEYLEYIKPEDPDSETLDVSNDKVNFEKKEIVMDEQNRVKQNDSIFNREVKANDHGYYRLSRRDDKEPIQISTFFLEVEAQIVQGNDWWFRCNAVNKMRDINQPLVLNRKVFQSSTAFKRAISVNSNLEYYGNNKDTTQIQGLLSDQKPPLKSGTDKIGMHKIGDRWVYLEGDNAIDQYGPTDDIVYIGAENEDYHIPTILKQPDIRQEQVQEIADCLFQFNDGSITYPIIGWIGHCFVKERLSAKCQGHNPSILNQGEPGTGKTDTYIHVIQSIFSDKNAIINIADATKFTFAVDGSRSNMIPCYYDEWKKSAMKNWQIKDMNSMLLAVYNQTKLPRGQTNQTINNYEFTAPLAIGGEMTIESPSIKHRIVEVHFNYPKRQGKTQYFEKLRELPLGALGKGLLQHVLRISDEKLFQMFDEQKLAANERLDDRFRDNAALVRTGLWLIMDYLQANGVDTVNYNEGFGYIDRVILETKAVSRETNVDRIIEDFSIMANTDHNKGKWLENHHHYEVRGEDLYIRIAEAYALYQRYAKSHACTSEPIGKSSFLQQLQSKQYFVSKGTIRIDNKPCRGIRLCLKDIPDYMDVNFPTGNDKIRLAM